MANQVKSILINEEQLEKMIDFYSAYKVDLDLPTVIAFLRRRTALLPFINR